MRTIILAALLVLVPFEAQAVFITGNDLVKEMREYDKAEISHPQTSWFEVGSYTGFVMGVFDAYDSLGLICSRSGVKAGQIYEIVKLYLKSNPDKWHMSAIWLVREALVSAFPCH